MAWLQLLGTPEVGWLWARYQPLGPLSPLPLEGNHPGVSLACRVAQKSFCIYPRPQCLAQSKNATHIAVLSRLLPLTSFASAATKPRSFLRGPSSRTLLTLRIGRCFYAEHSAPFPRLPPEELLLNFQNPSQGALPAPSRTDHWLVCIPLTSTLCRR